MGTTHVLAFLTEDAHLEMMKVFCDDSPLGAKGKERICLFFSIPELFLEAAIVLWHSASFTCLQSRIQSMATSVKGSQMEHVGKDLGLRVLRANVNESRQYKARWTSKSDSITQKKLRA